MNHKPNHDILVRTEHLTKVFPDGHVNALRDVSIEIRRGEYLAIMGPSGSGKSTLLSMLGGLDRPTSGEVYFEGQPLSGMKSLDRFRSRKIGFVFQSFYLLPTLTALENVQIPMFESETPAKERVAKAKALLESVNMSHRANHLPSRLSVGERQRVAIARSLANDPLLLFGDEPTGNLDTKTADTILHLFAHLHDERGVTLVVVTHSDEVAACAERIIHIRDGQVAKDTLAPTLGN